MKLGGSVLVLLSTCFLLLSAFGPGASADSSSGTDGIPASQWSSAQTAARLHSLGIISEAAAKRIENHNLNFVALSDIVESKDADIMRDIGLPTDGVAKYRLKADLAALRDQVQQVVDTVPITPSQELDYAKMDFFEVREADKARFDAFLTGCGSSPQVTILMYYFHDWDFLEHFIDADTNMVLFWVQWLLVPNFLASRMMWHFSDTNFIVACVFAIPQLLHLVNILGIFFSNEVVDGKKPSERFADVCVKGWAAAFFGVIAWRVLISYFLFGWVEDLMFYSAFFVVAGIQLVMALFVMMACVVALGKDKNQ